MVLDFYKEFKDVIYEWWFENVGAQQNWGTSVGTVVILGTGASKNYKPAAKVDIPGDKDFFKKAKEQVGESFIKGEFQELDAFLRYISPDPYTDSGPGLEATFTLIETFQRWFKFGKGGELSIDQSVCAFYPPLPYSPLTPVLDQLRLYKGDLQEFPNKYFGYDTEQLIQHQIDLCVTISDLEKGKINESFNILKFKIDAIRYQLSYLIYIVLKTYANDNGTYEICMRHKKFFEETLKDGAGLSVISFNYDLVADAALAQVLKEKSWKWNAETFYFQLFDPTPRVIEKPDTNINKDIFLLKLHGSINWYLPLGKDKQFICGELAGVGPRALSQTEAAAKHLEPVIVPPLMDKFLQLDGPGRTGHFGRSWTVAFDSLIKAKKWIFVGYSLPPTDFHATWLFQMAAAHRRSKSDPPQIETIDISCCSTNLENILRGQGLEFTRVQKDLSNYD